MNYKKIFSVLLFVASNAAVAQTSSMNMLQLPSQGSNFNSGQDRVRSSDGVECVSATGPRRVYMETGVIGSNTNGAGSSTTFYGNGAITTPPAYQSNTASVYARIVINLDKPKAELDCSSLFELEIERLKRELLESKMEVQQVKSKK